MRPRGMLTLTVTMGILNLTAFGSLQRNRFFAAILTIDILIVLATYALLWFFWKGRNWTRICVLVVSVMSVANFI